MLFFVRKYSSNNWNYHNVEARSAFALNQRIPFEYCRHRCCRICEFNVTEKGYSSSMDWVSCKCNNSKNWCESFEYFNSWFFFSGFSVIIIFIGASKMWWKKVPTNRRRLSIHFARSTMQRWPHQRQSFVIACSKSLALPVHHSVISYVQTFPSVILRAQKRANGKGEEISNVLTNFINNKRATLVRALAARAKRDGE